VAHSIPTATPGINQQNVLDRLTFTPQKKNKKRKKELNNKNELKRIMQQKGQGALSAPEKGGKANS
jgi:hypothetical protein